MAIVNDELAKTYFQVSIKDHAKKKGMWSGSFSNSINEEFILENGKFSKRNITYPQALYKGVDEILVNSIDQWIKSSDQKKYRVTKIVIEFSPDGYISIFNNGNGIPVDLVNNINGDAIYVPQLISTEFLAGSNNTDDENRISGGTNGLGIKLTSNNSRHFVLETVDLERKKHYIQESHNRLERTDPPRIQSLSKLNALNIHKKGGTTFRFLPEYDIYKINIAKDYNELNLLFKTRAIHTAAHTGLNVVYNGEDVKINNMETFAGLFLPQDQFIYTKLKNKYDWDVIIGISNTGSYETLSIINGICVKTGTHLNYVRDLVIDGIRGRVEKLLEKYIPYKKSILQNNLFIMISGNIPNPAFDSQSKTNIAGSISSYKDYTISPSVLTKFWKLIEPRLVEQYLTDPLKKNNVKKANTNGIKKYKKAKYAATNKSLLCTLLICEGDSAESMTRTSLTSSKVPMDYDYYGTFNIGGVPMNSRTKSTPYESKDGTVQVRRQKQLTDNERLTSLEKVCNLNHGLKYDSKEERDTLSYGCVVACVDQDLDGVGQIFGLLLSHFERFWPCLIHYGYVKQLATPIIRAFPKSGKSKVESFYTDEEYRKWVQRTFSKGEPLGWEIKYYKGLATHNDDEAIHMFQKYNESLYTITHDKLAAETFNIYYGGDPDLRKVELVIKRPPVVVQDMHLSCTDHLQSHTKEFQLDNIMRKLPHMYDGLNPARRKILCASRKRFLANNAEVKVFQLAGYVAEHMNYHHGSASLEKTIINMAQDYVGANNLPLLLPLSQFGCLDPNTAVILWNGTIKLAKDVIVGDKLMGDDGTDRTVLKTLSGEDTMFRIINGDMTEYSVNSSHILTLYFSDHKLIRWYENTKTWVIRYVEDNTIKGKVVFTTICCYRMKTKDEAHEEIKQFAASIPDNNIIDIDIRSYINMSPKLKASLKGVINSMITDWEYQHIDIDPYILGSWICGVSNNQMVSMNLNTLKRWTSLIDMIGCNVDHYSGNEYHVSKKDIRRTFDDIEKIRSFKRDSSNKYIPSEYIFNSSSVRLQLLAGIIDSCGIIETKDGIPRFKIYKNLDNVQFLESCRIIAGSLGYKATVESNSFMLVMTIAGHGLNNIPTRIMSKQIKLQTPPPCDIMTHDIQVRELGVGKFCGWSVDKNERFLLGDFTITHNSRFQGGKDYGAPRYIKTKLNRDLVSALFRTEDDYVLDYTYDEGVCNEPVCYIPVAPLLLLESLEIPATGWKYTGYARDWKSLYSNILALIKAYDPDKPAAIKNTRLATMPFWKNKWRGESRIIDKQTFAVGSYTYDDDENVIEISELPFQEWNESYVEKISAKTYVASVDDNSSKLQVNIRIKLKPDGFDGITSACNGKGSSGFDIIEDYCLLKSRMGKHLNVIQDGIVRECSTYKEILLYWFNKRYDTYIKRFDRMRVIIRLRIIYVKQVIKFVEDHSKYNFSILDEDTAIGLLRADKFIMFNKSLLDNPEFTPIDEMESRICNSAGTSYNYLFAVGPKQRMEEARIARAKKLKELEDLYNHIISDNIIKQTWLEELKELDIIITKGTTDDRGWLHSERKVKFE